MELADKIVSLRRRKGWSQEELAERLEVTRQSVSKWESGQSTPDLDRILLMSELFGVSTDFLLKDGALPETPAQPEQEGRAAVRRVSLKDAEEFLAAKRSTSGPIATAVYALILSPLPLMLLAAAQDTGRLRITEEAAAGIGLGVLLLVAAAAVTALILCRSKTGEWDCLEKEELALSPEAQVLAEEEMERTRVRYVRVNAAATGLCILSAVPLFVGMALTQNDLLMVLALAALFVLAGAGVMLFIRAGIPWASLQKLLQQEEYTPERKRTRRRAGGLSAAYWLVVTAIYLLLVLLGRGAHWDCDRTWVIWPVAGLLYAALAAVLSGRRRGRRGSA